MFPYLVIIIITFTSIMTSYLVIAVPSLWPGYLTHPIDFQNLDSAMKTSFHNVVMKEDLDIESSDIAMKICLGEKTFKVMS